MQFLTIFWEENASKAVLPDGANGDTQFSVNYYNISAKYQLTTIFLANS